MRFMEKSKDGGPESPVDGYFVVEIKSLFSIVLLKFNKGYRETFHNHAFNAYTWFLSGAMTEEDADGTMLPYRKSLLPKVTKREKMHRVLADRDSWAITIRGPWNKTWKEYNKSEDKTVELTNGRKPV